MNRCIFSDLTSQPTADMTQTKVPVMSGISALRDLSPIGVPPIQGQDANTLEPTQPVSLDMALTRLVENRRQHVVDQQASRAELRRPRTHVNLVALADFQSSIMNSIAESFASITNAHQQTNRRLTSIEQSVLKINSDSRSQAEAFNSCAKEIMQQMERDLKTQTNAIETQTVETTRALIDDLKKQCEVITSQTLRSTSEMERESKSQVETFYVDMGQSMRKMREEVVSKTTGAVDAAVGELQSLSLGIRSPSSPRTMLWITRGPC